MLSWLRMYKSVKMFFTKCIINPIHAMTRVMEKNFMKHKINGAQPIKKVRFTIVANG